MQSTPDYHQQRHYFAQCSYHYHYHRGEDDFDTPGYHPIIR